jgi:hypothetical protein
MLRLHLPALVPMNLTKINNFNTLSNWRDFIFATNLVERCVVYELINILMETHKSKIGILNI